MYQGNPSRQSPLIPHRSGEGRERKIDKDINMFGGNQVREETNGTFTRRRISVSLTIIALILLSIGITQAKLDIGYLGLIHSFPIIFFIALGIIVLASSILWTSPRGESRLLITQLLFLNASLWLAPLLVGSTVATAPWIYEMAGFTDYITRMGHFDPSVILQHNWPGAFIQYSVIENVLGLHSPNILIQLAPFIFQLMFLVLLFLFLKNIIGHKRPNLAFAGLFVFSLANWGPQTYLSSQSLAYTILLLLIAFLSRGISSNKLSVGSKIVDIILVAFITATHLVTSVVAMAVGFVHFVRTRGRTWLVLIIGVFIAFWAIYVTKAFLASSLKTYIENALNWQAVFQQGVIDPSAVGSASRQAISQVKIILSAIFLGMALTGLFYSWKRHQDISTDKWILGLLLFTAGASIFIGGNYSWELLDRFWLFTLPFVVYFIIKLLESRFRLLLCGLLVFIVPCFFIGHYGSQITYHVSPDQFASADFFEKNTDEGELITWSSTGGEKNIEQYYRFSFIKLRDDDSILYKQPTRFPRRYIEIGEYDERKMDFLYSDGQFVTNIRHFLTTSPEYNLIYTNPEVDLFVTKRQP